MCSAARLAMNAGRQFRSAQIDDAQRRHALDAGHAVNNGGLDGCNLLNRAPRSKRRPSNHNSQHAMTNALKAKPQAAPRSRKAKRDAQGRALKLDGTPYKPPSAQRDPTRTPNDEAADAKRTGRPSIYSQTIADRICTLIRNGATLRDVGRMQDCPTDETINVWIDRKPDFSAAVARAREAGAWALVEVAKDIADACPVDSSAHVAKARLMVDTRFKLAAGWNPVAFGNRPGMGLTVNADSISITLGDEQLSRLAGAVSGVLDAQPLDVTPRTIAPPRR